MKASTMSDSLHIEPNPFMLMINPEVVLAAIENSTRLGQLNSRLCRPLDRPQDEASADAEPGDLQ